MVDHDTGRLVWAWPGRDEDTVTKFFDAAPAETIGAMVVGSDGWPSRSSVEAAWRQVVAGERSRESVHDWSAPWVEGSADVGPPHDVMVGTGLQYLHGLDMTAGPASPDLIGHGGSNGPVLSDEEVVARLEYWLEMCREYDEDPRGFVRRARKRAGRAR